MAWLPIKSAPRDSTPVLLLCGETIPGLPDIRVGAFVDGRNAEELGGVESGWLIWNANDDFFVIDEDEAVHWMPLPAKPEA